MSCRRLGGLAESWYGIRDRRQAEEHEKIFMRKKYIKGKITIKLLAVKQFVFTYMLLEGAII